MTEIGKQGGEERAETGTAATDRAEVWGRRIGRALGWSAAAFLVFQLLRIYGG